MDTSDHPVDHQTQMARQLTELNGSQASIEKMVKEIHRLIEKSTAPDFTLDEITLDTTYKVFDSYGYLFNYLWVPDSASGLTLTFGNRIQEHTITLLGGWNAVDLFYGGFWKASAQFNGLLLRTKKELSPSVIPTTVSGRNAVIGTYTLTWAANDAANTVQTVSVPLPATVNGSALYEISAYNPASLASSVTLKFNNQVNFGAGVGLQYSTLTTLDIPSGAIQDELIQGWPLGDGDAQISATNDQAASATGGSVVIVVRAV